MKYSDFEKHLASELGRAEAPVQMESLLSALDLKEKPRRRPFTILTIIPILLLLGGLAYFATNNALDSLSEQNSPQQFSKNQSKSSNPVIKSSSPQNSDPNIYNSTAAIAENNNSVTAIENKQESQNVTTNSNQIKDIKAIISGQNEIFNQQVSARLGRDNDESKEVASTQISNAVPAPANTEEGYNESETSISTRLPGMNLEAYAPKKRNQSNTKSSSDNADSYSSKLNVNENVSLKRMLGVDLLKNSRSLFEIEKLEEENDALFSRMRINCPSFNQAFWRIALIPEVGILAPIKTLALKSGESSAAFNQRKANEITLEGINLGIYGMLVRDKMPFFLKAGLSYTKISERMDLEYNITEKTEDFGVIGITVSENGDSITTIEGPIIVETTYTGKNKRHHYVHLIDVPVSLGYTSYIGGFDIAIEGGVNINLMTRATGNQLVSQRTYNNLSFSQSFKRKVGLSYFGGLMVGRNFGRFGDFYLAPRFHYYPDDFTSVKNPISQKYVTIGINAGVIYKI